VAGGRTPDGERREMRKRVSARSLNHHITGTRRERKRVAESRCAAVEV
jgi:hypothetical protein